MAENTWKIIYLTKHLYPECRKISQNSRLEKSNSILKWTKDFIKQDKRMSTKHNKVKWKLLSHIWLFATPWTISSVQFSSVHFSRSVVSDSLPPHESQHVRPPCPSPTLGVHSDSHPLSQWCHPAISSYVIPFSSCPQSLPASESFPMSQLFSWGGQSMGVSALASFLP